MQRTVYWCFAERMWLAVGIYCANIFSTFNANELPTNGDAHAQLVQGFLRDTFLQFKYW